MKNCDLNEKLESITKKKTGLKTEQNKMVNLKIHDSSYFLGKMLFGDNVFKNMLVHQLTLRLKLKEVQETDYAFSWKSKGADAATFKPSYTKLLHSINLSWYRVGIEFNKDPLAVEQNNYAIKIVNGNNVYDLDAWPKNSLNNFNFKNSLATNIVKGSDKEKWMYSEYGIIFDRAGSRSFANDYVRNVVIFGVDDNHDNHADDNRRTLIIARTIFQC